MDIINNGKIELSCDDYGLEYTLGVYDTYGHYIDDVKLSREEIKDIYYALQKLNF